MACEQASAAVAGDRLLIARAGLIGGPGDHSDRTGYWVTRAARDPAQYHAGASCPRPGHAGSRRPQGDGRLAAGLRAGRDHRDVQTRVGPVGASAAGSSRRGRSQGAPARSSRQTGPGCSARAWPSSWARSRCRCGSPNRAGESSSARSGRAAAAAGLRHRPDIEVQADVLAWERERGLDRPRRAGLQTSEERERGGACWPRSGLPETRNHSSLKARCKSFSRLPPGMTVQELQGK